MFEDLNKKTVLKRVEDFLKTEKNNFVPGLIADIQREGRIWGEKERQKWCSTKDIFPTNIQNGEVEK